MAHLPAERCLAIIELLADGARDMPLGEIAERLALPKSGAHRLLATLVDIGWAEKDPSTNFYRLTMRLAILGQLRGNPFRKMVTHGDAEVLAQMEYRERMLFQIALEQPEHVGEQAAVA